MKLAESLSQFQPKSVLALRDYSLKKFVSDLIAGITVGLVALPLSMAFAISSGTSPQLGIYTAIIAGFLVSALGGSMTQIGGPTGAFVVVVAGIVQKYGLDGLYLCTIMAGVMILLLGITGLGSAVKFIPRPVVIGFTNGIAVLIASTQLRDFFGLKIEKVPGEFLPRIAAIGQHWNTISPQATLLAAGSLLLIILMLKVLPKVPGSIAALFIGTAAAVLFKLPVESIQTRFGGIPSGLPHFHPIAVRPELILPLLGPALTVTMLGAIESLLSAVVSDSMTGDRHNPNVELAAQGIANIASPLFGGLPATGAIARTATSIRSGAKTPAAGMIHALVLLCILLFAAPLAKLIPLSVLAGILMMVAWNMGEWKEIPAILKLSPADISVWAITFALTVLADLTVAVQAGMILAALLYIRKVTLTTTVTMVTPEYVEEGLMHSLQEHELPVGTAMFRIHGPFLFGSTDKLEVITDHLDSLPAVIILRLRNMTAIDATGLSALEVLAGKLRASGRTLLLCGSRDQPAELMRKAEFHEHIGDDNILPNAAAAIERARVLVSAATK